MMNKPGKKETRNSKTPPDKKKAKPFEQPSSPVQEEPEPVSCVLQGDEIQALAIKVEDLKKLHIERPPEEEERPSVTKKFLVRKSMPQTTGKKTNFLVAYPAVTDETQKTLHYSGIEGPVIDNYGHILSHSILGTLQEFKKEALARGHSQVAALIPDSPVTTSTVPIWWRPRAKHEETEKNASASSSQPMALQNWHRNMALRKKQQKRLCEKLQKSEDELLMTISDNYRRIQEERTLIDRSLPALYAGKGYAGNEFWTQPLRIGDELTGLMVTLGQSERGLLEPVTHIGRPRSIWKEMGTRPPNCPPFHKSLFLMHRRKELKEILEKMDFYCPDLEGLEVVGRNQPFVRVSAESFASFDDIKESEEQREIQDPLEAYPDVFVEPVLGPSLMFCGQPARWINNASHEGETGIAARITFEILIGEKAESWLTVSNDGTAAIWYDWRRQAEPFTFQEKKGARMPYFYFNTRSGVILPGETRKFSFIFKSLNAGIFSETWEFGTHPVLLGGAVLQVTLWGIALYEDKTSRQREKLEEEIKAHEIAVIVEENLKELLDRLHYQHQVVKGLHELWDKLMNPPRAKSTDIVDEFPQPKSTLELQQKSPVEDTSKSISPDVLGPRKSVLEEQMSPLSVIEEEEDVNRVEWNLSIADFRQILLAVPVEEEREAALAHLNKAALELCNEQISPQTDLVYQICFQLWREVIDGLVSSSLALRSMLGMPEKDTYSELVQEEPAEIKPVLVKGGKEDRKLQKEDKKSAGKEEKKGGKTSKEERPNSKKLKSKEERKLKAATKETKEHTPFSVDAVELEAVQPRQEQVDPVVQAKYHEKLYVEVYGLLDSMLSKMLSLFDQLKKDALDKKKKAGFGSDFIMK
ncbi:MYCBP-associated protein isoform X2 [Sphaerodactylus townsendi]|uniref:MYCBP-associated protein isoform X2 n=1 Tax=Sphaerodactylus townsendi TaxID=933632 RepID=UPI0020260BBA|nr:MYCBP-associated protein isoform X2 [Sphaerodactylus townsendi]